MDLRTSLIILASIIVVVILIRTFRTKTCELWDVDAKKVDVNAKGVIVKSVTRNGKSMAPNGVAGQRNS